MANAHFFRSVLVFALGGFLAACGGQAADDDDGACERAPVCDLGDEAVETCPADGGCYTASACGSSIQCLDANDDCDAPKCAPGSELVEQCPADATCVEQAHCGESILCVLPPQGCPAELVTDGTACHADDAGLECEGEGSDSLCGDWTCSCQADGGFSCEPGWCE